MKVKSNKNKDTKIVPIEIRKHRDKKGGHPHVIVDNIDNKYVSVGLTTDKTKGKSKKASKNKPLAINPLGGNQKSYMRREGTVDKKTSYGLQKKGDMSQDDFQVAKHYGSKAKEKYISKSKNKKRSGLPNQFNGKHSR